MSAWSNYWKKLEASKDEVSPQVRVGRINNQVPVSDESWQLTVNKIITMLGLEPSARILDLAGGNGLFSRNLKMKDGITVCADLSHSLLLDAQSQSLPTVECDLRSIPFANSCFDAVVLYAALQYLDENEVMALLGRCREILVDGGRLFIGDVPDVNKRFKYFNNDIRRQKYFESLVGPRPMIGTWFANDWIKHCLEFVGFNNVQILKQSEWEPYKEFRFDVFAQK